MSGPPLIQQPKTAVIGHSVQGRPIYLHHFFQDTSSCLNTLFLGVFHGDEGIAGDLLNQLLSAVQQGQLQPPKEKSFAIVPIVNPDGLEQGTRVNANGVDLNRNFPTLDWQEENQDTPYYSGSTAASEPETQAILRLLETHQPSKIITVHSPYRVLNYDGPGRALADTMSAHSSYPVVESIGYPTPGSFGTYVGKERHIPTITLELPEDEPLQKVWEDNHASLLAALVFES
jgi:murein peptide amidase A